jgi:hypothetical protein
MLQEPFGLLLHLLRHGDHELKQDQLTKIIYLFFTDKVSFKITPCFYAYYTYLTVALCNTVAINITLKIRMPKKSIEQVKNTKFMAKFWKL